MHKVVVADPAWLFDDKLSDHRGAASNYDCLTVDQICDLSSGRGTAIMGQSVARDAALFLWRVASQPQEALDVVRCWNFVAKSELIWLKKTVHGKRWFGMGWTLRAEHEACILATRGRPRVLNNSTRTTFVTEVDVTGLSAPVGRHSEKPEKFYEIVESLFEGPYLELFARRRRPGWTCVGKEL